MRIYLVGYMGSGKSTFGKKLSKAIGFDFLDLDAAIEKISGKSVRELFAVSEVTFRLWERKALLNTVSLNHVVVATGGGTACHYDNMDFMNQQGLTVYIEASPPLLADRLITEGQKRPLLDGLDYDGLLNFIDSHLSIRKPFYTKASICINAAQLIKGN